MIYHFNYSKISISWMSGGMTANVLRLCDGGDYLHNCPSLVQKLNSSAMLNGGKSAPLLAIYCWQQLNF